MTPNPKPNGKMSALDWLLVLIGGFVALGLAGGLGAPAGQGPKPSMPPKDARPSGVVIEVRDVEGQLVVLPWDKGGPIEVGATDEERAGCPRDAHYPDCL